MRQTIVPDHPGRLLKEELDERGLSVNALALALRVPSTRIHEIVHERRSITPDTSARLGRYFGASPGYWRGIQIQYDAARVDLDRILAEVLASVS